MLGRPAICDPVWKKVIAGSWLIASVTIDFTTQMSSAIAASMGQQFAEPLSALPVAART